MKAKIATLLTLIFLVSVNYAVWTYVNNPLKLPSWNKTMMGLTFSPMRRDSNPRKGIYPTKEQIAEDVQLLVGKAHSIRTYTSLEGMEVVPELAAKYGEHLAMGAWIDDDLEKNRREIESLIALTNQYPKAIVRTIVGNESILRGNVEPQQIIEYIREVKKRTWKPVSTSETWDVWKAYPELADEADYIAVHILPYWEGIPVEKAVDYIFERYHDLQQTFPGKQIVITEVGWPSDGKPFAQATPSLANEAKFLREFLNRATKENLIYYVVEAFDQPWKIAIEGSSGAYWGLFNVDRQPKFPMEGDVLANPTWRNWATGAALLSIIIMVAFLFTRKRLRLAGKFFFGIVVNLAASVLFWSASIVAARYQTSFSIVFWAILLMMQMMAILVLLTESLEISEVLWHRKGRRSFKPLIPSADFRYPKVSVHLPIHNEPPEMVRKTLHALANVDYPHLEVLVMDNNTKDPDVWRPVQQECDRLGPMFRFFHLDNWPGFKAGAINYALANTAEDAEIIAVIDSDYILSPDWLRSMVPFFDQDNVGFVQSPQDYRDANLSTFKEICYWEYAGFFNIGMVQRNEYNAIIQHGTMTMIKKSAFAEVGEWSEWCICEDSELGLRLYEAGYDSVYCKESFGRGLMPDTFSGYMTQRFRWVYGAMQIIKRHWRHFLPSKQPSLTSAQRYYFVAGWLPWFSDALALVFTMTSLILTAMLLQDPEHSELPVNAFLLPTIGLFAFKVLRGLWLYKARVACSLFQSLGAALAGLSLTHTVARGTLQGLFTSGKPFMRTPKYEKQGPLVAGLMIIWQELLLLILLITGIVAMRATPHFDNLSGRLWVAVLAVQAVPYIATFLTILISVAPNYLPGKKLTADELDQI
ncbi:MAG: glycosyltransferase [Methylomonas sp.]|jgi:exo-beta-1,3-glucanase (GH17 family)/cellulose synthase/poly-beta-1,6-N-acetylglucosamine synthase-like glycosyltransferase